MQTAAARGQHCPPSDRTGEAQSPPNVGGASSTDLQAQRFTRYSDKQIFERGFAVLSRQTPRITLQQDLAARQEKHAVAHFLYFVHVVCGPENASRAANDEVAYA